jgi:hypothetical protein
MRFLLADSFTAALARLPAADANAVKTTVVDLQIDASGKGLSFRRIDRSKDPNFWSVRVSRDLRLIVHKTEDSLLLTYVDHHEKAYAWAERRRIEALPVTRAVQIVELSERVEEITPAAPAPPTAIATGTSERAIFPDLSDPALLSIGVPADCLGDVHSATGEGFLDLALHLPAEATEALLQYATTGALSVPAPIPMRIPMPSGASG